MSTLRDIISGRLDVEGMEDMPDEVIRDTLESIDGTLADKADAIAGLLLDWKRREEAIGEEIKRLQARKSVVANDQKRLKTYLQWQLGRLNEPKIETDLHTVSLRKGQMSVVIDDPEGLPDDCLVYSEPKPNKKAIKEALEDGRDIPARLERGASYVVVK